MPTVPTFQAVGSPAESNTVDITPVAPAHKADDLLILEVENRNQPISLNPANGYVECPSSPQGTGTPGNIAAVGKAKFWKRATSAAETNPTVTFVAGHHQASIYSVRNAKETGNPFNGSAGDVLASADTAVQIPSVNAGRDNSLVDVSVTHRIDGTTPQVDQYANANLESLTERLDVDGMVGNGGGYGVATGIKRAAGPTGITTAVLASASAQARIGLAIAPRVAPWIAGVGAQMDWSPQHFENYARLAWPTHEDGDILLLLGESDAFGDAIVFDERVGLDAVPSTPYNAGQFSLNSCKLSAFWKRAQSSSELGPMIRTQGDHWVVVPLVIRGCVKRGSPFNFVHGAIVGDDAAAPTTAVSIPGGVTTDPDCYVLAVGAHTRDLNQNAISAQANADLAAFETLLDGSAGTGLTSFGKGGGFSACGGRKATAGAFGATTWTLAFDTPTQAQLVMAFTPYAPSRPNVWAGSEQMDPMMRETYPGAP